MNEYPWVYSGQHLLWIKGNYKLRSQGLLGCHQEGISLNLLTLNGCQKVHGLSKQKKNDRTNTVEISCCFQGWHNTCFQCRGECQVYHNTSIFTVMQVCMYVHTHTLNHIRQKYPYAHNLMFTYVTIFTCYIKWTFNPEKRSGPFYVHLYHTGLLRNLQHHFEQNQNK